MVSNMFYFHPYLGKISILTNIFEMGWNHQPVIHTFGASGSHGSQDPPVTNPPPPGCIESPSEVLVRLPGVLSGTDPFPTRPGPLGDPPSGRGSRGKPQEMAFLFRNIYSLVSYYGYGCQFTIPLGWKLGTSLKARVYLYTYMNQKNHPFK